MASLKYPTTVWDVAGALKKRYHDYNHYNLKDPLDELLFIICSIKTGEASYRSTYRSLKESFHTHLQIAEALAEYIARPIVSGGLSNQKAKTIRNLFDIIVAKFGEPTLKPLRKMNDEEAEAFLLSLPGVGKKVARCVLMYSLGRQFSLWIRIAGASPSVSAGSGRRRKTSTARREIWTACNPKSRPSCAIRYM